MTVDAEKGEKLELEIEVDVDEHGHDPLRAQQVGLGKVTRKLLTWGVETRGIYPVPSEQRADTQFHKIFFVWFSMNFNILSFSAGTTGPLVYGLGLRDSCLIILFFNFLCCAPPAYLSTWGPKLGLRQMCQSRYSFGFYGAIVPSVLSLLTMTGFMILNCILGGQTLAAVSNGNLSWTVGIVIIAIISLLISFCGYTVLNWYERLSWIPVLIVYIVALGIGGKHLSNPPASEPTTAASALSFASVIAGFILTYAPLGSDYTTYMDPTVSSWRIFAYSFLGFFLPIASIQCLGAAFAVATPLVSSWSDAALSDDSLEIGALFNAVLSPAGGFGKFLTVLLSLSVTANIAPTMYSFGLAFQVFVPFCAHLPRYVFAVLATAVVIPLSIVGAHRFYQTLTNFLGLIGYWAANFIAVVLVEHFVFRARISRFVLSPNNSSSSSDNVKSSRSTTKGDSEAYSPVPHPSSLPSTPIPPAFQAYNVPDWNTPSLLPSGIPALLSSVLSFALVIPCMDQIWFIGPIAKAGTGDIGFEVALIITTILYVPLRWIEIKYRGRL